MTKKAIIVTKSPEAQLSKEQKQFNRLNSQIEKKRKSLLAWQAGIDEFKKLYLTDLHPLIDEYDKLKIKLVYLLDAAYDNKIFTKTDRKKISHMIENLAHDLIAKNESLKEIYNKRSGNDYDQEELEAKNSLLEVMQLNAASAGFKVDFKSVKSNNPEDYFKEFVKQIEEQTNKEVEEPAKRKTKKTAKTLEKEAKLAEDEKNISQSIREVYRQLARAIHPDRETDAEIRKEKTQLMQKVNKAYNNNDLITLLQIQLEIEQIDAKHINEISIEKIKYYNVVLKRQVIELEEEIFFLLQKLEMEYTIHPRWTTSPKALIQGVNMDILETSRDICGLTEELKRYDDYTELKKYVKCYTLHNKTEPAFFF